MKNRLKKVLGIKTKNNLFSGMNPSIRYAHDITYQPPVFVTGSGRSGTHYIAKLFAPLTQVSAYHLDDVGDSVGDSFTLYSKWHDLSIDQNGFLNSRGFLIEQAAESDKRFLESNPIIAFSILDLYKQFDGQFIIMIRNPKKVIESHYRKGWYNKYASNISSIKTPGYQYFHDRPNHFFSRITPRTSEEYSQWLLMPRLGKIAWMWQYTYQMIFNQLEKIPQNKYVILQLEKFSYEKYLETNNFLEITESISEQQFNIITNQKPGKGKKTKVEWNNSAKETFNVQIGKIIKKMPSHIDSKDWLFD